MCGERAKSIAATAVAIAAIAAGGAACKSTRVHLPVLTWNEYVGHRTTGPYILNLATPQGRLLYFGSRHTFNPADPQIGAIRRAWDAARPSVVLCEGTTLPVAQSPDEAVSKYGEHGLVWLLANRAGVPIRSIDPPLKDQVAHLLLSFPADEVKMYYALLMTVLMRDQLGVAITDDQVLNLFRSCEALGCVGDLMDLTGFELRLKRLKIDPKAWRSVSSGIFYGGDSAGYPAAIHAKLNEFRDQVMLRQIIKEMKRGGTVFALAGKSHVAIQEPALRAAAMCKPEASAPR